MSENEDRQFQLGEDITDAASAAELTGTGILDVELPVNEIEALELFSERIGKSSFEVAKEAIQYYIGINSTTITLTAGGRPANTTTGTV